MMLVIMTIPEGLPLTVTLALTFATKQMTAENLLRMLGSCKTMTNASIVCTNKAGTLIQSVLIVTESMILSSIISYLI